MMQVTNHKNVRAMLMAMLLVGGCSSLDPGPTPPGDGEDRILPPVVDPLRIVPGESIGPIALGDAFGEVTDILGPPSRVVPSSDLWTVFFFYPDVGIFGSVTDENRNESADPFEPVRMILANAPFAGSYGDVGIGSFRDDVTRVMGEPQDIIDGDHWYWTRGIVWTLDTGVVTTVGVFEPILPQSATARSRMLSSGLLDDAKQVVLELHDEAAAQIERQ